MTIGYRSCDRISWPAYVSDGDQTHYVNQRLSVAVCPQPDCYHPSTPANATAILFGTVWLLRKWNKCRNNKRSKTQTQTCIYLFKVGLRSSIQSCNFCIGLSKAPATSGIRTGNLSTLQPVRCSIHCAASTLGHPSVFASGNDRADRQTCRYVQQLYVNSDDYYVAQIAYYDPIPLCITCGFKNWRIASLVSRT